MPTPKTLLTAGLAMALGSAIGACATYSILSRKHKAEASSDLAAIQYMRGSQFLELIGLSQAQGMDALRSKLNYELAGVVFDARGHENDPGEAGFWYRTLMEETAKQRNEAIYKSEEAKLKKDLDRPHPIL